MVFNEVKEDFCITAGDTALSNSLIFGLLFAYLSPTRPFLSLPTLSPMPATYDSSCLRPAQSTEHRFRNHRHQNPTQPPKQCPHQKGENGEEITRKSLLTRREGVLK